MGDRVFRKKQSSFLWPTHLNLAVSVCKETIYQKSLGVEYWIGTLVVFYELHKT